MHPHPIKLHPTFLLCVLGIFFPGRILRISRTSQSWLQAFCVSLFCLGEGHHPICATGAPQPTKYAPLLPDKAAATVLAALEI